MPDVTVRVPVFPSEDPKKVERAVRNLFPNASITAGGGTMVATTDTLETLGKLLKKQKILDAARRVLLRSLEATHQRSRFRLSKQAAFRGRVGFSEDTPGPLGDLEVLVEDPRLEEVYKAMAPMTIRGIPVSEERAEQELARRRARRGRGASQPEWDKQLDWDDDAGPEEPP